MTLSGLSAWRRLAQLLVVTTVVQGLQVHQLPLLLARRRLAPAASPGPLASPENPPSLVSEALAQPVPPGVIPLPSPIVLARTQSAFSLDTLGSGNSLAITYTVFNRRDEEVGEILVVTTLQPGVTLIAATPTPDQPTPPDGRLAFVLPSIPPFGQVTATLTVSLAPMTLQVDSGARAFGNLRTRSVDAGVGPTTLRPTLGVNTDLLRSTIDANTSDRYVLQTIGEVGCDPAALFGFVRGGSYTVYAGRERLRNL